MTVNQMANMEAGIKNATKPFQAKGPILKKVIMQPSANGIPTQKLKKPIQRGNTAPGGLVGEDGKDFFKC